MNQKIRWGVIGSGGIARRRTIPEGIVPAGNAELAAVFDINLQANAEVARQFNARAVDSLEALLRLDVDAVYIATPVNTHAEQTCRAVAAGKHVLCEKPLAMTVAEARASLKTCHKARVNLGVAFMMRYHSQHQAALKLIQEGRIGKPVYARAQLSCWYPPMPGAWRQEPKLGGGGALIDMGGHCLDLLEMFFGPVEAVSCCTNRTVHAYASEDSAVVLARFRNGALATVDACFCIPDNSSKNRLELYGSKGSILAQGTIGQGEAGEMTAYLESDDKAYNAQQARDAGAGLAITPPPVNMYRAEIEAFSQALLEDRDTKESALAGLRSQIVLEACYRSARSEREIRNLGTTQRRKYSWEHQ
ncbi:MAG: Gfo/Idh/MocA family oxidoreductase [Candidatus Sumerlaeota bacterium]|nr:Gfo/Idh/MocA family oxidoreductase [Candidatus Sumerlaeota bacterium]